jgi:hypothetical protein
VLRATVSVTLLTASTALAAPSPETRSAPRADWPCRLDVVAIDAVTWTFEYDGPDACTLPLELHGDGIVGCPTAIRIENPAAHYNGREALRYDATGQLTSYQAGSLHHEYIWEHGHLRGEAHEPYRVGKRVVKLFEGKPMIDIATDAHNRAIAIAYTYMDGEVTGRAKLIWKGTRLVSIETRSLVDKSVTRITPIYTCN